MRAIPAFLAFSLLAGPVLAQGSPATPPTTKTPPVEPAPVDPGATPPAIEPALGVPVAPVPLDGTLSVASTPSGAAVFLDGKDTGLTTPVNNLPVAAGSHVVKVLAADGRSVTSEFTLEAAGALNRNLTIPQWTPSTNATAVADPNKIEDKKSDETLGDTKADETPAVAAATPPPDDWSWMTVTGWSGLGLGTIGLLSGAVVLTTPTDPQQGPLGFGLFGAGVGLVLGGAVLLYLDSELSQPTTDVAAASR